MHLFVIGNFDHAVERFVPLVRREAVDRRAHRFLLADRAEIRPGPLHVAGGEEQPAYFLGGFDRGLLITGADAFVEIAQRIGLDQGQTQLVPFLHQPGFENQRISLLFLKPLDQQIESRIGVSRLQGILNLLEHFHTVSLTILR